MNPPLVSVIIPNHDTDRYLHDAIESVDSQSYEHVEIVLVDSSDINPDRFSWCSTPIRYIYQEPNGPGAARNRGIEEAEGELIAFLDADDWWDPSKLARQVDAVQATDAEFVYTDFYEVKDGELQYYDALPVEQPQEHHADFFHQGGIGTLTVLITREALGSKRFDESLRFGEDRHLWVRVLRNCVAHVIHEPLAYYRQRRDGLSGAQVDVRFEDTLSIDRELLTRFEELGSKEDYLSTKHYNYARTLFDESFYPAARRQAIQSIRLNPWQVKPYPLLIASAFPVVSLRQPLLDYFADLA